MTYADRLSLVEIANAKRIEVKYEDAYIKEGTAKIILSNDASALFRHEPECKPSISNRFFKIKMEKHEFFYTNVKKCYMGSGKLVKVKKLIKMVNVGSMLKSIVRIIT